MRRSLALLVVLISAIGVAVSSLAARLPRPRDRPDVSRPAPGQRAAAGLLFGRRLDLNAASPDDLAALPGVGSVRAARIVDERARRGGRFESLDELLDVPGVGEKTLARIRPHLRIAPAP